MSISYIPLPLIPSHKGRGNRIKTRRAVSTLFPSSSLGIQLCRSSSFGEAVPKPELGNEGKDHFEILASSLERQRVSAVAGGKLELPGQAVPKPELGNEGKRS